MRDRRGKRTEKTYSKKKLKKKERKERKKKKEKRKENKTVMDTRETMHSDVSTFRFFSRYFMLNTDKGKEQNSCNKHPHPPVMPPFGKQNIAYFIHTKTALQWLLVVLFCLCCCCCCYLFFQTVLFDMHRGLETTK